MVNRIDRIKGGPAQHVEAARSIEQAPAASREWLVRFEALAGTIVSGPVTDRAITRFEYVDALFSRSTDLVKVSSGVVAFVSGVSRGTWFTCEQAVRLGKQVVLFSTDRPSSICSLGCGRWKPLGCWHGAWLWEPSVPVGKRCRHGILVQCRSSGMNQRPSGPSR